MTRQDLREAWQHVQGDKLFVHVPTVREVPERSNQLEGKGKGEKGEEGRGGEVEGT